MWCQSPLESSILELNLKWREVIEAYYAVRMSRLNGSPNFIAKSFLGALEGHPSEHQNQPDVL
jgi:hypothetical protein